MHPDYYLDELQERLKNIALKDISLSSVWRELDNLDITNKQVSNFTLRFSPFLQLPISFLSTSLHGLPENAISLND